MAKTAKLFLNGRSQAVRLPAEFRFEGKEVFIRRDDSSGDVILSKSLKTWDDFIEMAKKADLPAEFMSDRQDDPPQERDLF
jgi:antitoxin VapB